MRILSDEFLHTFGGFTLEPRIAFKVNNDQGVFWVTSHGDIDTGVEPSFPYLTATQLASQKIEPEKGFSSLGGASFRLQDQQFTAALAAIDAAEDSLINNIVEVYLGYEGMTLATYGLISTLLVDSISNTTTEYTIRLKDRQRFIKRGIFEPKSSRLFAVIGGGLQDLTDAQVMTEASPGTIEVLDASEFERVQHDSNWAVDAGQTIGYVKIKGVDAAGNNTFEVFSYTGISGNRLTGVVRQRFNTQAINAKGSVNDGNTEVSEYIYLDLPAPKLILAILTGDLYQQPGASLPDHWHAGLPATAYELGAIENIGNDLWELPLSFRDPEPAEAKFFLSREVLRLCNLFFKINQFGRLELRRFAPVLTEAPTVLSFGRDNIESFGGLRRDASAIRNRFLINWEWRPELERFTRNSIYVDAASISRNNTTSDFLRLEFKGVRNRTREMVGSLNGLADGLRARYSDPAIRTSVTVPMQAGAAVEVGDVVGVEIPEWPDYVGTNGRLSAAFEVQSTRLDFATQKITLELYSTSGRPGLESFARSDVAVQLNHNGWRRIEDHLTGGTFTISGSTLTITGSNTLSGQSSLNNSARYYWDGELVIATGVTLTTTNNTLIDAEVIELQGTAKIDAKGRGYSGGSGGVSPSTLAGQGTMGYFGGGDLAEEGVCQQIRNSQWFQSGSSTNIIFRNGRQNSVGSRRTQIESFNIRVDANGTLRGLPSNLMGNSGNGGQYSIQDISPKEYAAGRSNGSGFVAGGNGGNGGGGLVLLFENLFMSPDAEIDTSGGDSAAGSSVGAGSSNTLVGGSGGPGYPGCLVALSKSRTSALPFLTNRHFGRAGSVATPPSIDIRPNQRDIKHFNNNTGTAGPWESPTLANRGRDFSRECRLVKYIFGEVQHTPSPGVDPTGPAALPTDVLLVERINTPRTPKGDRSTITITAVAPSDPNYDYAVFDYRIKGQDAWYPAGYAVRDQTTIEVTTDGTTYEVSARSVSVNGQLSTARLLREIKVKTVSQDPTETDTDDEAITLLPIRRLELVNRVNDGDGADEFKGPDAEIRWAKLSITGGGSILQPDGFIDQHLAFYRIQVYRTSDGELLREIETLDTFYVYTLADNRRDNVDENGDPDPIREFQIDIEGVAKTGKTTGITSITVSNPAPAAPSGVILEPGFGTITGRMNLPSDPDFIGFDISVDGAAPFRIAGNEFKLENLNFGQEYNFDITSVDRFGLGGSVNVSQTTKVLTAADVAELSLWATETDPVDLAFIQANMAADAIASEKVQSLTVAKVTAGQITVQWDLGTGILLDGVSGVIESINSGYSAFMGPVNRAAISANPLVFHTWNGTNAPFWVDANGNAAFGKLLLSADGSIGSDEFTIGADGSATYSGALSAASGTFAGTLSAADGVFGNKSQEQYIEFDPSGLGLVIGRRIEAVGIDSFNNESTYDSLDYLSFRNLIGRDNTSNVQFNLVNAAGEPKNDSGKRVGFTITGDDVSTSSSPKRAYWLYSRAFSTQAMTYDALMGFKCPMKIIRDTDAPALPNNFTEYTTKILFGFGDLPFTANRAGYEVEFFKVKDSLSVQTKLRTYPGTGASPEEITGPTLTDGLAFGEAAQVELFHTPGEGAQLFVNGTLVINGHAVANPPFGAMTSSEASKFFVHGDSTFDYPFEGKWILMLGNFKFVNGVELI